MNGIERNTEILEMMKNRQIRVDDKFLFHCTACGECCQNRSDILMSPYDAFRAARILGMQVGEMAEQYCEWYVGGQSLMPILAARMLGRERVCPFLDGKKCRIHKGKPAVCELYPLGRGCDYEKGEIIYFLQPIECGKKNEWQTPRKWMSGTGLEEKSEKEPVPGRHEEKMTLQRAKELLNMVINHISAANNCRETLKELLHIGFTPDELNGEFGFSLHDIADAEQDMESHVD